MYTKTQIIIFTDMLVQSNKMLVQFNRMLVQLKQIFKLDGLNPFNFSALAPLRLAELSHSTPLNTDATAPKSPHEQKL